MTGKGNLVRRSHPLDRNYILHAGHSRRYPILPIPQKSVACAQGEEEIGEVAISNREEGS